MVYIDRYIHIYKFKYVYVHIRVRQQLEYTPKLKTEKRETRPFNLGWRAPCNDLPPRGRARLHLAAL
jgi:hypothetical protein